MIDTLDLAHGDRVELRSDELGARHLHVQERGDAWPRSREIEGYVVDLEKVGDTVHSFKVRDPSSGAEKWVRPRADRELAAEFSQPVLDCLRPNDFVRVAPNALQITPAVRHEHAREIQHER